MAKRAPIAGFRHKREDLLYLLTRAAEYEHSISCMYLFAAFSLKNRVEEGGLTIGQVELARGWKSRLLMIARQEMEHLGLVSNILLAVGGAPHFFRPAFPVPAIPPVRKSFQLLPFGSRALDQFLEIERPEWDEAGKNDYPPGDTEDGLAQWMPQTGPGLPFLWIKEPTLAHLYASIKFLIEKLDGRRDRKLFIGPEDKQIGMREIGLRSFGNYDVSIDRVRDRDSALGAVDRILKEGEGAPRDQSNSHYGWLREIQEQFQAESDKSLKAGREFEPARPVVDNPCLFYARGRPADTPAGTPVVTRVEPDLTRGMMLLFDEAYETMLLMLTRFYAHTDESRSEVQGLQNLAFFPLMTMVIRPLGEMLTRMPAFGGGRPGTAGPDFTLHIPPSLLPHRESAWIYLHERLAGLGDGAGRLTARVPAGEYGALREEMDYMAENLSRMADNFNRMMKPGSRKARKKK